MSLQTYVLRTTSALPAGIEQALDGYASSAPTARELRLTMPAVEASRSRRSLLDIARSRSMDLLFAPAATVSAPPCWVFFDGDATLLAGETIDELARVAGVHDEVAAITTRAMAGELDFEAALRERVALLKGLPATALEAVIEAMPLTPGAQTAVRASKTRGIGVTVLSGGFHFLLDRLQERLGLDGVAGNRLVVENGKLTGELEGPVVDARRKADLLRRTLDAKGLTPMQAVAVGDGANDVPMLEAAGLGLGYRAKPALLEVADGALYRGGLDAMLDLLQLR